MKNKPRLTPQECRWFDEVHGMVLRVPRWFLFEQAFTDTHDGGLLESEVMPLVKKKLLIRIRCEKEDYGEHGCLLGSHWHVIMAPRTMRALWSNRPDAMAAADRIEGAMRKAVPA